MKVHGIATVVFLVAFASTSQGINSTYGNVGPYDKLLHREFVILPSKFLRVVSKDVEYPPKGYKNQYIITAIRSMDKSKRQDGGFTTLYRGGPGFRNVTLHLQSSRSRPLNFTVEIYGH